LASLSEVAIAVAAPEEARARTLVGYYAIAIAIALAIEGALSTTGGAVLCAILVAILVNRHVASIGAESDADGAFLVLGLVALAGLIAVVMPTARLEAASWPLLVAGPLILALVLTARQLDLDREALGLTLGFPVAQLGIALLGAPLGLLAYLALRPAPFGGGAVALAVLSVSVLAFVEELLFRGLVQPMLCRLFNGAGIVGTAGLSAAVALGAHSLLYGLFAGLVAGGFGVAARRTGSIAGTSAARALMFIGLLVVWPLVLG
jgi:uncharacterized protein